MAQGVAKLFALIGVVGALISCSEPNQDYPGLVNCVAPGPDDVSVTWMGVAGLYVRDGKNGFLIDPFVSQNNARIALLVRGGGLESDMAEVRRWTRTFGPVDGIFITHSHHDHAMDAPAFQDAVAEIKATRPMVYGGDSTGKIMSGHGASDSDFKNVEPDLTDNGGVRTHETTIGDFTVTMQVSSHGAGLPIPGGYFFRGRITRDLKPGSPVWKYRAGTVFAMRIAHVDGEIFYIGSGHSKPGMFPNPPTDKPAISILTLSGREDTGPYLAHTVGETNAKAVIPIHFDDIFQPPTWPPRVQGLAEFANFTEVLKKQHKRVAFRPQQPGVACAAFGS